MTVRVIAAVLFFVLPGLSYLSADVYRWTAAQGNAHYGNQPPPDARDARVMVKEQTGAVEPAAEDARTPDAAVQELEDELRREADARRDADSVRKNAPPDRAELVARE